MKREILKNSYQKVNFKGKGKKGSARIAETIDHRLDLGSSPHFHCANLMTVVRIRPFEGQQTHVANRVADPKTGKDDLARAGQTEHEIFNKTQLPRVCTGEPGDLKED